MCMQGSVRARSGARPATATAQTACRLICPPTACRWCGSEALRPTAESAARSRARVLPKAAGKIRRCAKARCREIKHRKRKAWRESTVCAGRRYPYSESAGQDFGCRQTVEDAEDASNSVECGRRGGRTIREPARRVATSPLEWSHAGCRHSQASTSRNCSGAAMLLIESQTMGTRAAV